MTTNLSDLKRAADAPPGPQEAGCSSTRVPPPKFGWKTRVLLPAVVVLATAAVFAHSLRNLFEPAVAVEVVPAVIKETADAVTVGGVVAQAPGWVEPDPFPMSVPALADGVVREVLVLEGQAVKAGQVLVRLVDDDARLALAQAEASLRQREAELALASAALGRDSAVGTATEETQAELDRLPAAIAALEAKVAELRVDLQAKRKAASAGVISQVQVETLEARLGAQQGEMEALRAQKQVLEARRRRQSVEARSGLDKAQAALEAARSVRDEAALRLARMEIRSPADGVVMIRRAEPGSTILGGLVESAPFLRLYDPQRLQVRVDVPLASAARVSVGQKAEVVVDVLPDQTFEGVVSRIVHEADIQRNTLQFKVSIALPSPQLKPEMLARVRFFAPPRPAAATRATAERVFVPASAVDGAVAGNTATVWVADLSRNLAQPREVTIGLGRLGEWVEVASGLVGGDRVIVSPRASLKPSQRIRVTDHPGMVHSGGNSSGSH